MCSGWQPEADKLFKEVFKAKEEVSGKLGTGKKIQDAGRRRMKKMWKVEPEFSGKGRRRGFLFC